MRQGDKGTPGGIGVDHHGNGNRSALLGVRLIQSLLSDVIGHIGELTISLDGIKNRIDYYRNSQHESPVLQDVLDLQGWARHLEPWNLHMEGLRY
jgi:hypothetical protein